MLTRGDIVEYNIFVLHVLDHLLRNFHVLAH